MIKTPVMNTENKLNTCPIEQTVNPASIYTTVCRISFKTDLNYIPL
nr:MAG TPA: hypothetical protein [Caudoviricetes sp.]